MTFKYDSRLLNFCEILVVFLTLIIFASSCHCEFVTSQAVVQFDPYVSILDRFNRSRYDIDDLQFMIAKVATRFSRIYFEIEEAYLYFNGPTPSICLAALATAKYNCLNSTTNKIEVWLGFIDKLSNTNRNNDRSLNRMLLMANAANNVCNGTVTTLLFTERMLHFLDHKPTLNSSKIYNSSHNLLQGGNGTNIGFLIGSPGTCEQAVINFRPAVILVHQGIGELSKNKHLYFAHDLGKLLKPCKSEALKFNKSITWAVLHSVPDTDMNNLVNTSFLVSSWLKEMQWGNQTGTTVVFQKAFDTPYKISRVNQIVGWWRLKENFNYRDVKEFVFEEKFANAAKIDWEENPRNFKWLQESIKFNKNSTGVIHDISRIYDTNSFEFTRLQELVGRNFNKHLFVQEWLVERNMVPQINFTNSNIIVMYMIGTLGIQPSNDIFVKGGFSNFTFLIPLTRNHSIETAESIKNHARKHNLKYGYCFKISLCAVYTQLSKILRKQLFQILTDTENNLFVFNYEENEETIKLGARRMYERRVVLFEQCRQMVHQSGNLKTEIGFSLLEYSKHKTFYQSPWHLQNYVRYWKMLNDWAVKQENITVFIHATDQKAYQTGNSIPGWWTFEKFTSKSKIDSFKLVDKREYALKVSETQYPPAIYKRFIQPTMVGLIVFGSTSIFIVIISLSIFFIKRHYRRQILSKYDLENFFQGETSNGSEDDTFLCTAPYDKEKYEITKYSVDRDNILGTGEFGQVLHGHVQKDGIEISVAIKTTNPQTNHSSTLKGLLSEVKLLAYIGKHKNIIELIGADTSELKRGKILIFLELCHLGSLQKYLRKIRIPTDNAVVDQYYSKGPSKYSNCYTNMHKNARKSLDSGLSKDLYRWSSEICNGMAYLAEKHVVHADLATRNVLLSLRMEAKICDFGLSRKMYNYTNYVKGGHDPMPWKWMAPESLKFRQFSEKSDVWAFGITLWEIYTLGETPYQGLSWDVNFAQMLERGLRPSEPTYNENDMFKTMSECWKTNDEQRPTFSQLLELITANG